MTHKFDTKIAEDVGVNAAIIYENLLFWCLKNKANNKQFHDDNYWTYNSIRAWKELFPYLSESSIKTALKKLEDNGFILSGNYNKSSYDRTKWYCIVHLSKIANGKDENSQPIPDNKLNNASKETLEAFESLWKDYTLTFLKRQNRKGGNKKKAKDRYLKLAEKYTYEEIYKFAEDHATQSIGHKDLERLLTVDMIKQYFEDKQ